MNSEMNGGGTVPELSGEWFPHQPVLYQEVLDVLAPESGKRYLDGTLGAGGHAKGLLTASAPNGQLMGFDLDQEALAIAQRRLKPYSHRTIIRQASYIQAFNILQEVGWQSVDGILLDLGVSSMQIDRPERGFSFSAEGPLDMRFNQKQETTAADLVNNLVEAELADILWQYGEERYSKRIARSIVAARPIHTTQALVKAILEAVPGYEKHLHPATRTFQALRIATNNELETIAKGLPELIRCLAPQGRIAVISFHSLEDRIVKQFIKLESKDCICPPEQPICTCGHEATLKVLTRRPIRPTIQEMDANPRSRSAKLRVAQKLL